MPRFLALAAILALAPAAAAATTADFVRQMCIDVLHHPGAAGEMAALTTSINQGATRVEAASALITSDHGRAAHIDDVYWRYLGRHPAALDLAFFTNFLNTTGTYDSLNASILASTEYFNRAGGTNAAFLNRLFLDLLNRPVDPGSQNVFLPMLNGGTPRTTIATAVLTSLEYDRACVAGWYNAFLHRTADPGALSSLGGSLQSAVRDEAVIAMILGSLEYFNNVLTPCLGDTNGDRHVDFADLNNVLSQFGQMGPAFSADLDGDGTVAFPDLNIVLSAFGSAC